MNFCYLFLGLLLSTSIFAQKTTSLTQVESKLQQHQTGFEKNKGQVWQPTGDPATQVNYYYQSNNIKIFMLQTGIAYQFTKAHYPENYFTKKNDSSPIPFVDQSKLDEQIRLETYRMDMQLVDANPNPTILAEGKSNDYTHYYNRNALDVHHYQKLTYQNVYQGIDWLIYITNQGLKYDFIVHPGADPKQIKIRFKHNEKITINEDGSLTLSNRMGEITEQAPISFQNDQSIPTTFQLKEDNTIQFQVASYNKQQPLIIDPSVAWATYYGNTHEQDGRACALDTDGNIYLLAYTGLDLTLAAGGYQNSHGGANDALLVKFNSSGVRQWATYYGGTNSDYGLACTIDHQNNIYFVLTTFSTGIALNGHQNAPIGQAAEAMLVKLDATGNLKWATYYGSSAYDEGNSCTVDKNGNVYLAGYTASTSSTLASGGHQNFYAGGGRDAFLVKFDSLGVRQWATFYGSNSSDYGFACAVDSQDNVFLAGLTYSNNGPNRIAYLGHQSSYGGNRDAFLVKFNAAGVRQWGTYYGGSNSDYSYGCAADQNGHVYLCGYSYSSNNIAAGGYQNTYGGGGEGFLVQFDSVGVRQWGTYFGGWNIERFNACTVDANNNVYATGEVASAALPMSGTLRGFKNAIAVKFDDTGVYLWGTYYGGSLTIAKSCQVDDDENIYIAGLTNSTDNIGFASYQSFFGGYTDAFLAKIRDVPSSIDSHTACDSFMWVDGNTYTTSNHIATYVLPTPASNGLDSVLILDLTIHSPSTATDIITACDSIIWIDGNTYTSDNNTATYTLSNANMHGCDSIVTLDLTIHHSVHHTDTVVACDNFTWINGITYTSSTNTPIFTIHNGASSGCDSFVHLNLIIKPNATKTDVITACNTYTWIDGNTYTSNNNTATVVIPNGAVNGCDSIIALDLTIGNITAGTEVVTTCDSFTWINGQTYTSSNNTDILIIPNGSSAGCDSIASLNLTILPSPTYTDVVFACDSFTWINGNTYTSSNNTDVFTIPNGSVNGCDSIINLDLTFTTINKSLIQNGNMLMANEINATYQWLDCSADSIISGATTQSFVPTYNGDYAVIINKNNCIDTSNCINVTLSSLHTVGTLNSKIHVYPNPTKGIFTLELPYQTDAQIQLINIHNQLVFRKQLFQKRKTSLDIQEIPAGVYLLKVQSLNKMTILKLVKQ